MILAFTENNMGLYTGGLIGGSYTGNGLSVIEHRGCIHGGEAYIWGKILFRMVLALENIMDIKIAGGLKFGGLYLEVNGIIIEDMAQWQEDMDIKNSSLRMCALLYGQK